MAVDGGQLRPISTSHMSDTRGPSPRARVVALPWRPKIAMNGDDVAARRKKRCGRRTQQRDCTHACHLAAGNELDGYWSIDARENSSVLRHRLQGTPSTSRHPVPDGAAKAGHRAAGCSAAGCGPTSGYDYREHSVYSVMRWHTAGNRPTATVAAMPGVWVARTRTQHVQERNLSSLQ